MPSDWCVSPRYRHTNCRCKMSVQIIEGLRVRKVAVLEKLVPRQKLATGTRGSQQDGTDPGLHAFRRGEPDGQSLEHLDHLGDRSTRPRQVAVSGRRCAQQDEGLGSVAVPQLLAATTRRCRCTLHANSRSHSPLDAAAFGRSRIYAICQVWPTALMPSA